MRRSNGRRPNSSVLGQSHFNRQAAGCLVIAMICRIAVPHIFIDYGITKPKNAYEINSPMNVSECQVLLSGLVKCVDQVLEKQQ
jgi:hypothetical protein